MQISQSRIEIKLHGASTTRAVISIRAEHALTNGLWIGADAFLSNKAMGTQLADLFAMDAGFILQLEGSLLNGEAVGVVDLHDGVGIEKGA